MPCSSSVSSLRYNSGGSSLTKVATAFLSLLVVGLLLAELVQSNRMDRVAHPIYAFKRVAPVAEKAWKQQVPYQDFDGPTLPISSNQ